MATGAPPDPAAELVDVIDDAGRVVATVTRATMRADRLAHRCVFIVVRRSDGRVLVHRRSQRKDLWPSAWDLAVGGVVGSGEGWDEAAARELAEEVRIAGVRPAFVREARYVDEDVAELARVYEVVWDGPIAFTDGEVVEALWLSPAELAVRMTVHHFCPDSVALAADLAGLHVT